MSSIFMSPLFFVFGKIVDFGFEEFSEETGLYNDQLQDNWFAFWEARREEIVNSSWSHKYSEYLIKEGHKGEPEDTPGVPKEERTERQEEPLEAGTQDYRWQGVWDEHYIEVCTRTYQLFSIAHYDQYRFYRRTIEDLFEELLSDSQDDKVDQTEQLRALGLPTSFEARNYKYHNSRLLDSSSETDEEKVEPTDQTDQLHWRGNRNSCSKSVSDENLEMPPTEKQTPDKQSKKKKKNRKLGQIPKVILENRSLRTYWQKRFSLFSRFDEGIQLDRESWFSVTPEKVAIHMAERLRCDTIIDGFCGSGGNAIQFAFTCSKVIAIDIDAEKIKNARHNAIIYGVANKIEFIIGDYLQLCGSLKGDVVFLSPPWGGPKYISKKEYDIEESLLPVGASALAEKSRQISENIAFFLPRNSNPKQITKLAGVGKRVEIEHNYLDTRLVGLTAIYGDWLIDKKNLADK